MRKQGVVIGETDGKVRVAVMRQGGCGGNCGSCGGCGETKPEIIEVMNDIGSEPGDIVEVKADGHSVLKYTMVLYSIPLILMIVGIVLGYRYFAGRSEMYELLAFGTGIVFLALSLLILRGVDRRFKKKTGFLRLEKIDSNTKE